MEEYMYNIYNEEAEIIEKENGITTVTIGEIKKEFLGYDRAIHFLERKGFRF